jgi:hypothetical protein
LAASNPVKLRKQELE